jgi:hypothetical protein
MLSDVDSETGSLGISRRARDLGDMELEISISARSARKAVQLELADTSRAPRRP